MIHGEKVHPGTVSLKHPLNLLSLGQLQATVYSKSTRSPLRTVNMLGP
jgi:hypothetical protein